MVRFYVSILKCATSVTTRGPIELSIRTVGVSSAPLFLELFDAITRGFRLSFSPARVPGASFLPSGLVPVTVCATFLAVYPSLQA